MQNSHDGVAAMIAERERLLAELERIALGGSLIGVDAVAKLARRVSELDDAIEKRQGHMPPAPQQHAQPQQPQQASTDDPEPES